jgi:hypothetical protein
VVVTTAPERRTTQTAERLRVLTARLGRAIGVPVTAPTCPAGVRTDRPTEFSCVVGFAGIVVAFYVRDDAGVEHIRASMPVMPTAVLNRAAGGGAVCSTAKVVVAPVGTSVTCTLHRRASVDVVITEELAAPYVIDTAATSFVGPAAVVPPSTRGAP